MPWSPAQERLFQAAAHNPAIAKARGIPQPKAAQMAAEGIAQPRTKQTKPQKMAALLSQMGGSHS